MPHKRGQRRCTTEINVDEILGGWIESQTLVIRRIHDGQVPAWGTIMSIGRARQSRDFIERQFIDRALP